MTDIVERLRYAHKRNMPADDRLMSEAADEIASLRAALRKIGERAPDADTLGVQPGFGYWCSVAEHRLQIAREALPDERF